MGGIIAFLQHLLTLQDPHLFSGIITQQDFDHFKIRSGSSDHEDSFVNAFLGGDHMPEEIKPVCLRSQSYQCWAHVARNLQQKTKDGGLSSKES